MQIISGLNQNYKRHQIIQKYVQEAQNHPFEQYIYMFTLIIRALIVYLIVLFVFRLMGKRQLGQMQPFEFVLALIIADLATIPMAESSVPILHGIVPLLTLVTLHYFLTIITKKSEIFNKIISGKPVIVINPRGIDY